MYMLFDIRVVGNTYVENKPLFLIEILNRFCGYKLIQLIVYALTELT